MSDNKDTVVIDIVVDEKSDSLAWPRYINSETLKMPDIALIAGPVPPGYQILAIEYSIWIVYNENGRQDISQKLNNTIGNWGQISWPNEFLRGGVFTGEGRVKARTPAGTEYWDDWREIPGGKILGTNPPFNMVKLYLENQMPALAVAWQKSGIKMFEQSGEPAYNISNSGGFGMFQISNFSSADADGIWNWKKNSTEGLKQYVEMQQLSKIHERAMMAEHKGLPELKPGEKQLEIFQRFTNSHYFIPVKDKYWIFFSRWVWQINNQVDRKFADDCNQFLKRLLSGESPEL